MTLENYKLKQQQGITAHILEQPKSKTLTMPYADEDMEQQEFSLLGMQNDTDILQDILLVSYKTKHTLSI